MKHTGPTSLYYMETKPYNFVTSPKEECINDPGFGMMYNTMRLLYHHEGHHLTERAKEAIRNSDEYKTASHFNKWAIEMTMASVTPEDTKSSLETSDEKRQRLMEMDEYANTATLTHDHLQAIEEEIRDFNRRFPECPIVRAK